MELFQEISEKLFFYLIKLLSYKILILTWESMDIKFVISPVENSLLSTFEIVKVFLYIAVITADRIWKAAT